MNFNSELFLFYFLPVWAAAYAAAPERYRNFVALSASLLFYAWGAPQFIIVVVASAALDWIVGRALVDPQWESRRKILLFAGISINVAILLVSKYANFVVDNVSSAIVALGGNPIAWTMIALPIGVSFIVFEKISYLVDIWRGVDKPTKTFRDYLLYVFLFPKMIAGPIVRYHTIATQLESRSVTLDDWKAGFMRFIVGLAKKVLIADSVAPYANTVFGATGEGLDAGTAWLGLICFTLQIYFDFSGYSDMAIGLCRMMGIRILENFDTPYISQSFVDGAASTRALKTQSETPVFNRYGTHWNLLGAYPASRDLLAELARLAKLPPPALEITGMKLSGEPIASSNDLALMMGLETWLIDPLTPHPQFAVKNGAAVKDWNVAFVGGSFVNQPFYIYEAAGAFSRMIHYWATIDAVIVYSPQGTERSFERGVRLAARVQCRCYRVGTQRSAGGAEARPRHRCNAGSAAREALIVRPACEPALRATA